MMGRWKPEEPGSSLRVRKVAVMWWGLDKEAYVSSIAMGRDAVPVSIMIIHCGS
jgi:hypothetical protein